MSGIDRFFSQLEDMVGSLLGEGKSAPRRDADYQEAWQELDDFLRTGENPEPPPAGAAAGKRADSGGPQPRSPGPDLSDEYRTLEVPLGAPFEQVRTSYRRLIRAYHPDKYADDPEKQRVATQISSKLNASFQRIREAQQG